MACDQKQQQQKQPTIRDIGLVMSDVDGTLLDSNHKMHPRTFHALKHIRENYRDLPIVIATGKMRSSLSTIRSQLNLDVFPCSHLNGGVVYGPYGEILQKHVLSNDFTLDLLEFVKSNCPETNIMIYDATSAYTLHRGAEQTPSFEELIQQYGETINTNLSPETVQDRLSRSEIECVKMILNTTESEIEHLKAILRPFYEQHKNDVAQLQALSFSLEFISHNGTKGNALKFLLQSYFKGINASQVLAFGDGQNDVSMFNEAGWSYAMCQGMGAAKDAAKCITRLSNDYGGVGETLERIFQIQGYTPLTSPT